MKRRRSTVGASKYSYSRRAKSAGGLSRMSLTRMVVPSRVHTFKRLAEIMYITAPDTTLIQPGLVGAGNAPFPYIVLSAATPSPAVYGTQSFGSALTFMIQQCANRQEILQLFDNYRIERVQVRFDYTFNSAPGAPGAGGLTATQGSLAVPTITVCPDFDDAVAPIDRNTVLQNSFARTRRLDRPFTITLKPRAQATITRADGANPTTAAGGLLPAATWLDSNSPTVPHYGLKFWVDDFNVNGANALGAYSALRMQVTYFIAAKNVV